MSDKNSKLVYSTDQGRIKQGRIKDTQHNASQPTSSDGIVRISRETKGRKGKGVTLISGLCLEPAELNAIAKKLKQVCGTGGTVKNGVIEIQGDHRQKLHEMLSKEGHTVKLAGG